MVKCPDEIYNLAEEFLNGTGCSKTDARNFAELLFDFVRRFDTKEAMFEAIKNYEVQECIA